MGNQQSVEKVSDLVEFLLVASVDGVEHEPEGLLELGGPALAARERRELVCPRLAVRKPRSFGTAVLRSLRSVAS